MSEARSESALTDLIGQLRHAAGELASLAAELPTGQTPYGQREEEWSGAEVIAHLAHFEVLAGARIRMVLTLELPPLAAFDQEEFNRRFAHTELPDAALNLFTVNRSANCDLLARLAANDWERKGLHPTRGEETLARTMAMLARHDREHLDQLRRAIDSPA